MASILPTTNCGTAWSDPEVIALIGIWGGNDVQEELDGAVRNKIIYEEISKKMYQHGYNRDMVQCRNKIKNLKKEYRSAVDSNKETGRGRKTCKFFNELDSILGHRPATAPPVVLDTGESSRQEAAIEQSSANEADEISQVSAQSDVDGALIPPSPAEKTSKVQPPPPKKRKTTKAEKTMDTIMENLSNIQQESERRMMDREEQRWTKEMEMEAVRRSEEREHHMRMLQMISTVFKPPQPYSSPRPDFEEYYH